MMSYFKNGSRIKIFIFPRFFYENVGLLHIGPYRFISFCQTPTQPQPSTQPHNLSCVSDFSVSFESRSYLSLTYCNNQDIVVMSACITSVCSNLLSGGHITTPLVSYRYSGQQIKHNGIFGLNHSTGDSNQKKILLQIFLEFGSLKTSISISLFKNCRS